MTVRRGEDGMVLINVLMFVAIAAGLVLLMINREELALERGLRVREAARALAAVRGGELSALVALRRDGKVAPEQDYAGEPWGALAEKGAPIAGGTFDLAIGDAEGKFNVNSVRSGEAASVILFTTLGREVGLRDDQVDAAIQYIRVAGPISDLRPLRASGFDPDVVDRLERLATALPGNTTINLNAASEEMLTLLFRDPAVAHRLFEVRRRQGFLTARDLADENATIPWGTSFRSTSFWVRTRATIGGTAQQEATLIRRRVDQAGKVEAVPVERWRNAAIPPDAPQFPERR